ncbi:MAG: o-succinylbenzoate synthase [Bacteroidia bacterium]|nr:o-succinylbenzoate synthase [Bacteroidia bacterium]
MRNVIYQVYKRELQFNFDAKTSRGEIKTHTCYILKATDINGKQAWGEAAPLKGLSIEHTPDFESKLIEIIDQINQGISIQELELQRLPSIHFALETLHLSLKNKNLMQVFDSEFLRRGSIAINGLVWMNTPETMIEEAINKARAGYDCIKFKIGAHNHDDECRMLEQFRKNFPSRTCTIRLDANGAFANDEALHKLKDLQRFEVHSIEQPIAPKQEEVLEEVCAKTPIHIALDEELIGRNPLEDGAKLLSKVKAKYLILKPSLIGGFASAEAWIKQGEKNDMHWWATSALESNIGLNAIAQWTAIKGNPLPQGLGTGALYTNNFDSPLLAENGFLQYIAQKKWSFPDENELLVLPNS